MKEYNRVTNEIHAPKELINKTKEAVRAEESREEKRRKSIKTFSRGLVAAAAVFVAVLAISVTGSNRALEEQWQEQIPGKVMLGQDKETIEKLEKDRTVIATGKITEKWSEAANREDYEINGIAVSVYKTEEAVAAEFSVDDMIYHAENKAGNEKQLLKDIEEYIGKLH